MAKLRWHWRWQSWIYSTILAVVIFLFVILPVIDFFFHENGSNEAAAIANLRLLTSVQAQYITKYGTYGTLNQLYKADYIEKLFSESTCPKNSKSGYYFVLDNDREKWSCVAIPAHPGDTGSRSFFVNETGEIRTEPCESKNVPHASEKSPT